MDNSGRTNKSNLDNKILVKMAGAKDSNRTMETIHGKMETVTENVVKAKRIHSGAKAVVETKKDKVSFC